MGWVRLGREAYLVRVQHEDIIPAVDVSEELQPTEITLEISPDLEFIVMEAIDFGLFEEAFHLLVGIAQP